MSKIGKIPVQIPSLTEVSVKAKTVVVKGPKGELSLSVPHGIEVVVEKDKVTVSRVSEIKKVKALHGAIRSIINNMVIGVTEGWSKTLEIMGTGYRAGKEGEDLVLNVGYSRPIIFKVPDGLEIRSEDNRIIISGISKEAVGSAAAVIRKIRPPDAYRGKGIRYLGEEIKLKPGKAVKA